jgi:spermidine/putrescine transport system substrate-binding protein
VNDRRYEIERAAARLRDLGTGREVTRGGFFAGAGVGLAAFLAACGGDDASSGGSSGSTGSATAAKAASGDPVFVKGGELNIYSWPDYFDKKNMAYWKQKTGAKVNIEAYESNEDMFAKLNTAARSSYDMAIPTSQYIKVMGELGIIQEIDKSRVPFQYIDPNLLGKQFDPENKYSIPKTFGTSGLLYNPAETGTLETYDDVIKLMQGKGSGKVNLPEGGKALLNWGMQPLGYKRNSTKIEEFREAADYLIKNVVKHVNSFGGTFDPDAITSGKVIAMTTDSSVARRAIIQDPKLKYVLLKPETEIWVDNYVIIKGTPNLDQVYSWLSYFLQPETQIKETEGIGYATALKGIADEIDASFKHPEVVFPTPEEYKYLTPTELHEDIQGEIDKLGNQVKAAA